MSYHKQPPLNARTWEILQDDENGLESRFAKIRKSKPANDMQDHAKPRHRPSSDRQRPTM